MIIGPCEHCPNPDKALWQSECQYKGLYPSHREFVRSNFDAPCEDDAHDQDRREGARDQGVTAFWITLMVTIGLALIFIALKCLLK